jgi:hypothetical protein
MSKRNFNYEYLPTSLTDKLNNLFSSYREYRTNNNIILIVGAIFNKQMGDDAFTYSFVPLSVEYWRKVIGSHYSQYMKILCKNNIIQTEMVLYSSDAGAISRVKGYRINPSLLQDKFSLIAYSGSKSESKSADIASNAFEENNPLTRFGFKPEQITMQKPKAMQWVATGLMEVINNYKNIEYLTGVPKTLPVLVRIMNDDGGYYSAHMSVASAQKVAEKEGKQLIYYKDKFIIANEGTLDNVALQNLTVNYKWQVKSFTPEKFNITRNKGTLRVYSKLSSLPSSLLPYIRINGRYVMQADLKCSQFTIFANLLNYYLNHSADELKELFKKKQCKTTVSNLVKVFDKHKAEFPDEGLNTLNPQEDQYNANNIYKFLVDALMHDFYTIIKSELNLPQREHAKGIAFRTVFSKPKPENELVKQFREVYPAIISIINDFKVKYRYNQFAIGLQRLESEIFIDNIWKRLTTLGINSFTRHDSIVFPITKRDVVEKIISDVFAEFDFIYRIEYEVFNAEEIEIRMINETDYIDSLEDNDEPYFDTMFEANKDADKKVKYDTLINRISEQLGDIDLPEADKVDYYEDVSLDTLIIISQLEGMSIEVRLSVEEDIANLQSNYPVPFFQDKTNKLIRWLVQIIN